MDFRISDHASKRLLQRKISREWVATALAKPGRTENDAEDPALAHALLAIPERGFRVLRVDD